MHCSCYCRRWPVSVSCHSFAHTLSCVAHPAEDIISQTETLIHSKSSVGSKRDEGRDIEREREKAFKPNHLPEARSHSLRGRRTKLAADEESIYLLQGVVVVLELASTFGVIFLQSLGSGKLALAAAFKQ